MSTVLMYDATGINIGRLPAGQAAGYTTGSGGIAWDAAGWQAHPGAVRICQDPAATDRTADVLDVEQGAATPAAAAAWAQHALAAYKAATRPGQRSPAVYASRSQVTPVVNALIAARIASGIGLWVADWDKTRGQAEAEVTAASGPFPVIGVQYANAGAYDISVMSAAWLSTVSGPPAPAPGNWTEEIMTELAVLTQGASGADVRTAQALLGARGFPVAVDGAFGPVTAIAVRGFQASAGTPADGTVGPATWQKLLGR